MEPEIGPKSFGTFEKQATGLEQFEIENSNFRSEA